MFKNIKKVLYRNIENREISYEKLKDIIKNRKAILIDVRSNQEYEEGHINGAINISLYNIEKDIKKTIKEKNEIIILYCSSGYRSRKAKEILEKMGYSNVYNLKNGIDKIWIN